MKARFYIDLYPGMNTQYGLMASTQPYAPKMDSAKRFAFDVNIPDELIYKPDIIAAEVGPAKEVE